MITWFASTSWYNYGEGKYGENGYFKYCIDELRKGQCICAIRKRKRDVHIVYYNSRLNDNLSDPTI